LRSLDKPEEAESYSRQRGCLHAARFADSAGASALCEVCAQASLGAARWGDLEIRPDEPTPRGSVVVGRRYRSINAGIPIRLARLAAVGRAAHSFEMRCLLLLLISMASCSDDESIRVRDRGPLCLSSTADGRLSVEVAFPTVCLSSSCNDVVENECTIDVAGNDIRVRSHAVIEDVSMPGGDCTADCLVVTATCEIQSLQPGSYRIVHGGDDAQVTIPSDPAGLFYRAGQAEGSCE
jgi:hypothetical protein